MRFLAQGTSDAARLADLAREIGVLSRDADPDIAGWETVLLALRRALSGPRISAELNCPDCGEGNALIFGIDDLPKTAPHPEGTINGTGLQPLHLSDLVAIETAQSDRLAETLSRATGQPRAWVDEVLSGPDQGTALEALERALSGLDIQLGSQCSACSAEIVSPFDVQAFVLGEVTASAHSLLDQVHRIARVYHWSETEILSLPRNRRLAYLDRIDRDALNIEVGHVGY